MDKTLTAADFKQAAEALGCSVAAVKAVAEVEAPRGGFNENGTPATLFEGHKFHKFTQGRFDASHPTLSYATWTREHYGKGWLEERRRLAAALELNREAALKATSWGKFQIMGFNHELAGYAELEAFVADMHRTEREHLFAFVHFVKNNGLDEYLRDQRWASFARKYNGPGFAVNHYDERLAAAFAKHSEET